MFAGKKAAGLIVLVILAALIIAALDFRLCVRGYKVDAPQISSPLRIALVTDLHSCYYGKEQLNLVSAIDDQRPDVVLLGGDIFDDEIDDANTESFLKGIAGRYPCFYVTGNHEYWSGAENFAVKMGILEKYGVTVLSGESRVISIRGESIRICGVDDPDIYRARGDMHSAESELHFLRQLDDVGREGEDDMFTILLSHRPEYFSNYLNYDFDLVLCGHAHGGQWRIPWLLNGLMAPNQGLFPEYAGGRYDRDGTCMIVSRGLARESTRIPRIFNRPELVIVDIH